MVAEYRKHPGQVKGFFQAIGVTRTPVMLLMVWRIVQGMEIKEVQMSYRLKEEFRLRVILESPYGDLDLPYESSEVNDFALFRHIGIMTIGDRPVLDGFYPLRVGGK